MDDRLAALLADQHGVLNRRFVARGLPRHVLDSAARSSLVRVAPSTYVTRGPTSSDPWRAERIAAVACGPGAAVSHCSALTVWGITEHLDGETARLVHVTVSHGVHRRVPGAVIHQRRGFVVTPPHVLNRHGLPVVRLDRAIVESWAVLSRSAARGATIEAVRARLTVARRVRRELASLPKLRGRAELVEVLALLEAGCHSELEIWGYTSVFSDPRLPPSVGQYPIRLPSGRSVHLDRAYPDHRVAVELDGARHHAGLEAREADVRRDAALAAQGWVTLRWTHRRLRTDRASLVDELLAVLRHRQRRAC